MKAYWFDILLLGLLFIALFVAGIFVGRVIKKVDCIQAQRVVLHAQKEGDTVYVNIPDGIDVSKNQTIWVYVSSDWQTTDNLTIELRYGD